MKHRFLGVYGCVHAPLVRSSWLVAPDSRQSRMWDLVAAGDAFWTEGIEQVPKSTFLWHRSWKLRIVLDYRVQASRSGQLHFENCENSSVINLTNHQRNGSIIFRKLKRCTEERFARAPSQKLFSFEISLSLPLDLRPMCLASERSFFCDLV